MKPIPVLVFFLYFLVIPEPGNAQEALVLKKFYGNKIELSVPAGFESLSPTRIRNSNPDLSDSLFILTDSEEKISISLRISAQKLDSNQIDEYGASIIKEKKKEPKIVWLKDGTTTIDDRNAGFFKFINAGEKIFSFTLYTSLEDKLLTVTIICPVNIISTWEDLAEEIAFSLKFHETGGIK